jgi:protein-tyrosine-phosphatase
MSVKRILFVCTGNSCRSVMAERLMRHLLKQGGIDTVTVGSAGVFAVDGMMPTRETQRVLAAVGLDCSDHRARALTMEMVEEADIIFVMEQFQAEQVLRRVPSAKGQVYLLKSYAAPKGEAIDNPNIPDPIGKPLEVYEVCFADIRDAVERVAKSIGICTEEWGSATA